MIDFQPAHCGPLHFIGIGGIGMSGIAEALHALGYTIQGSDAAESYNTERLKRRGITIYTGHNAEHVHPDLSAIVVSSAIQPGNPELLEARRLKLPIVRRADMLAEIMRHKKTISIAGTHGKTTTTSLVGAMLEHGGIDPTIINGGIIHAYGTNTRMGTGEWMVVESDESDGSFTRLPTTIAVVTNMDPEHMEHYGSFDSVRAAYRAFIENIPFYGFALLCSDHPEVNALSETITDRRIYTYGTLETADIRAENITLNANGATFDVLFSSRLTGSAPERLNDVFLPMMGPHNVLNALVPLGIGRAFDLQKDVMTSALALFQGVSRRFTKTGITNGITVIDDYGHHPAEIRATLNAARQAVSGTTGRIIAIMQPHRYTRLSSLFPEFCGCFDTADTVIITDVYAAGEPPIEGISGTALVQGIKRHGHKNVLHLPSNNNPDTAIEHLADLVAPVAQSGDFIICLGAGSITSWAHGLPEALQNILIQRKQAHG